ncbi:MAG: hypothetical protein A3H93_10135 [Rhodocyclales bacterium RIFCSPLOWO2_02_FULL_63_24]|nr:MAG: hypothetical protein A2040_14375 [Rhodocyclales bacterium GWA2_65_19]OHC68404.1 MAG: hypothetical protein A3H93_10135 [Rhodocyclales bacterium RIFCSPLOWO2_02_FULL_63_24]
MDFDFIGGIGWRDLVLVLAAIIGVYLVLSVMRLFQVGGRHRHGAKHDTKRTFSGWEPYSPRQDPEPQPESLPLPRSEPAAPERGFAQALARSSVEAELQGLRRESAELREELVRLAEEVSRLKASRNVSPLYNEAMTLAQQGMPADGIAGRCGISIGEAELVAALARGGAEFERHGQSEDRDERNTDSGNRPRG